MRRMRTAIVLLLCAVCTMSNAAEVYDNAVKVTFLSWITGSTKLSYERAFANHQSAEICASMIGAGYDKFQNNPLGFTLRYGHKFFLTGNHRGGLQGFYVRPEAIYSHYSYDAMSSQQRTPAKMGAVLATTGYQMHLNRLLIDAWVGGGYAFGNPAETGYHHGFALWNAFGKSWEHVALSFSVKLGICF
ncbi:MAG: DUF3575 domain-containing protein [Bacteroidaceae bacterium]|nr:DUF3575 domain-containing protein [Bacteroidaceae bacterium]